MHHSSRGLACILVSVFLGGILTFAFSSSSAQAQAVCVAPLSGPWSTAESDEIRAAEGLTYESPPVFTSGRLELVGEYGEAFVLHGGGASYTFVRSDSSNFGNVVYTYIDPTNTFTVRLDVETRERMLGMSVSQAGVSRRFTVNYQGSVPERAPECDCPGLDAFLHKRIEDGRKMQALYANPAYWERPPGWPPPPTVEFDTDPWNGNTYDRVIDGLATGKSYGEAVEAARPPTAGGHGVDPTRPQTAEESGTILAGSTNPVSCEITLGDAHFGTDFPWIAREQTLVHEQTHETECNRPNGSVG
ncbi:MAG: hypothetical protein IH855_04855 [Bacteroidetes bacterium]|nr:hypothetical protein [Bacteroidota bacterium]